MSFADRWVHTDPKLQNTGSIPQNEVLQNIDKFRKPYELPHLWELRKEFLKVYAGKYDSDRLVCLSEVFINVECMGLTYPDNLMAQIRELGTKVRGLEYYKHQLESMDAEPPRKQAGRHQHRR